MFSSYQRPSTTKVTSGANKLVRRGTDQTADMADEDDFSFSSSVIQEDSEVSWILKQMQNAAATVAQPPPTYNFVPSTSTKSILSASLGDDDEVKFIMGGMMNAPSSNTGRR